LSGQQAVRCVAAGEQADAERDCRLRAFLIDEIAGLPG